MKDKHNHATYTQTSCAVCSTKIVTRVRALPPTQPGPQIRQQERPSQITEIVGAHPQPIYHAGIPNKHTTMQHTRIHRLHTCHDVDASHSPQRACCRLQKLSMHTSGSESAFCSRCGAKRWHSVFHSGPSLFIYVLQLVCICLHKRCAADSSGGSGLSIRIFVAYR